MPAEATSHPTPSNDRHVLWVVGPALGHVSRSLVIARQLRKLHGIESRFIGPDQHGYHARLLAPEFKSTGTCHAPTEYREFAGEVADHVRTSRPLATCFDCSPLPWMLAMPRLPTPTAYITNHFLCNGQARTFQDEQWERNHAQWLAQRHGLGLHAITSARELYDCDQVLLADPPSLVAAGMELPTNHHVVGACSWTPGSGLPPGLDQLHDILFVSFGSTGGNNPPEALIRQLARACDTRHVVMIDGGGIRIDGKTVSSTFVAAPEILLRSRLALTHGGAGSTYQAMACGIPLAILPAHINHRILGKHIEQLGNGRLLDPGDWTGDIKRIELAFDVMVGRAGQLSFDLAAGPVEAARKISELIPGGLS